MNRQTGRAAHISRAKRRLTITVTNLPRGDDGDPQTLNAPNWPSSEHSVSVVFTDWPFDGAF